MFVFVVVDVVDPFSLVDVVEAAVVVAYEASMRLSSVGGRSAQCSGSF